ncbi:hypothetical protein PCASD_13062 [Puccinia coronata f. sp. avenae]|uniref:Uncharacterized protein n=1 Tax=Puccinia coronata f. sp. avenae TaxID=200324 RepID=A0A2N5U4C3_9BASI|nr:hypothetical protein PCASD_13062 [Puccinia coronata f. sp. avenae]
MWDPVRQGVIAHHPKYDKSCKAWVVGDETWRAFSLAAVDAGKHGKSALWSLIQVQALPRRAVHLESPDIMIMVPVVPPGHHAGN